LVRAIILDGNSSHLSSHFIINFNVVEEFKEFIFIKKEKKEEERRKHVRKKRYIEITYYVSTGKL
jgi:hypothetical protein